MSTLRQILYKNLYALHQEKTKYQNTYYILTWLALGLALTGIFLALLATMIGQGGLAQLVGQTPTMEPSIANQNWKTICSIIAGIEIIALSIEILNSKLGLKQKLFFIEKKLGKIKCLHQKLTIFKHNEEEIYLAYQKLK